MIDIRGEVEPFPLCMFALHLNDTSSRCIVGFVCTRNTQVLFVPVGDEGPSGAAISTYIGRAVFFLALLEFLISAGLLRSTKPDTLRTCDTVTSKHAGKHCKSAGGIYSSPQTIYGPRCF